jgi:phage/plasmid primase, P4 family, C-terminal domain
MKIENLTKNTVPAAVIQKLDEEQLQTMSDKTGIPLDFIKIFNNGRLTKEEIEVQASIKWEKQKKRTKEIFFIPSEMKKYPNFVLWKLESGEIDSKTGKPKKIKMLYQASVNEYGWEKAKPNTPETWDTFDVINRTFNALQNEFEGIGFVFSKNTGLVGIDFDHIRDPVTGIIDPEALEEIKSFNSYTEISQSGTGIHVVVKGTMPEGGRKQGDREMYSDKHFFALTGYLLSGCPNTVNEAQEAIDVCYDKWFPKKEKSTVKVGRSPVMSDDEVIAHCKEADNKNKFIKIFEEGNIEDYLDGKGRPDPNRADLALCSLIAFYTQDKDQIFRLIKNAKLYRDKWEREDYRDNTINLVIDSLTAVYMGAKKSLDEIFKDLKISDNIDGNITQIKQLVKDYLLDVRKDVAEEYVIKLCEIFKIKGELKKNIFSFYKEEKKEHDNEVEMKSYNMSCSIQPFNLEKNWGRGICYKTLTEDFLKNHAPVITFADSGELRIYQNGIYTTLEGAVEAKIIEYITTRAFIMYNTCLSPTHTENILKKIKTQTVIMRSQVDKDPFRLAVKNGILNIKTGELEPFNPKEFFTSKIDVEYNPEGKPLPIFKQYLDSTFKGVEWEIPVMQELLGYCLYRDYPYEYLVFLTGDGRNGKGTFFRIQKALVGEQNISSLPIEEITKQKSEFVLCDLFGKMVNLCGEIGKTKINETRDIKMLTGQDDISARFLYQKRFTFKNYAKMFFSCNEPPVIEDFTTGMKNRLKFFDFPNTFITGENAIDNLEEQLTTPESLTGIFNWALEGLHRLLNNKGKLSDPRSAAEMAALYEKKSNPLHYFVRDCIVESHNGCILREEVEEAYVNYAKKNTLPSLSKQRIKAGLIRECQEVGIYLEFRQIRKNQLKENCNIERPYVFEGIELIKPEINIDMWE